MDPVILKQRMNVAAALDSNYVRYTYVMLTSLLMNQEEGTDFHIYLLQSDLKEDEKEVLEGLVKLYEGQLHWLTVNRELFSADYLSVTNWSLETYYRLMLPDLLPVDVDRILYLDVDMIINKPLQELYLTDFGDCLLCACSEPFVGLPPGDVRNEFFRQHMKEGFIYFNAGMLLLNIEKMRGRYHLEDYLSIAAKLPYRLVTPDQDLLNFVHWKEVKILNPIPYNLPARFAYNCGVSYEEVKSNIAIIHFLGNKPWNRKCDHFEIEKLWWDYAEETPYYSELAEEYFG